MEIQLELKKGMYFVAFYGFDIFIVQMICALRSNCTYNVM